ncbi:MAG: hypothetical protein WAK23_13615, partial [Terriglobales bacterium]
PNLIRSHTTADTGHAKASAPKASFKRASGKVTKPDAYIGESEMYVRYPKRSTEVAEQRN